MKSIDLLLPRIIAVLFFVLLGGCGGGESPATAPGGAANATLPASLVSIAVTPANLSLAPGASGQVTAIGTYSDGTTQDLSAAVTWTSSGVVQVSATGLASSPDPGLTGTATIIATSGAISGFTSLTVTGTASPTTPVSIAVSPANFSIAPGATQQLTATGTYSNGTTRDLTAAVTWTSSGVVRIGATGLATSSSAATGTATVTATSGTVSGATSLTVTGGDSAANTMAISVNGSLCNGKTSVGYFNKPCVSVTVCDPGTTNCQTVNDILLDTGSYGLRIFKQAITGLALSRVAGGASSLNECINFADGSALWGPVRSASVQLGAEPPVLVPIQVMDASSGDPSWCSPLCADGTGQGCLPDPDPVSAGFTGILGVGSLVADCGDDCAQQAQNGQYFRCAGSSCVPTAVAGANQVQNPVAGLPQDHNGVVVRLAGVPLGGASASTGLLIFGVGTQANNSSVPQTVISTDLNGYFTTGFAGALNRNSFLDTGSNALYFASALPICSSDPNNPPLAGWYCASAATPLSAVIDSTLTAQTGVVHFNIGNYTSLTAGASEVFSEIGGSEAAGSGFDWGLPFFLGKSVFIGINGKGSNLGTGPFVAY